MFLAKIVAIYHCAKTQNELGEHSKVTLAWVAEHKDTKGNEKANALAKERKTNH